MINTCSYCTLIRMPILLVIIMSNFIYITMMYLKKLKIKRRERQKKKRKLEIKKGSDSSLENVNNKSQNENTYCGPDKKGKREKESEEE